jgi:hypothetical protein
MLMRGRIALLSVAMAALLAGALTARSLRPGPGAVIAAVILKGAAFSGEE